MMTDEVRQEIDQLREEIRQIGATLRRLREDLAEIEKVKTGPQGEIDLEAWNQAEEIRGKIRDCMSRRDEVQGRLNDLLRPFRAKKIVPVLRAKGIGVKEFLEAVKAALPTDAPSTRHLVAEMDEAIGLEDDGQALGKLLDLFLFGEVRGAIKEVLGIEVSNGNGR